MDRLWRTGAAGLWQGFGRVIFLRVFWRRALGDLSVDVCCVVIEEDPENDWKGVDVLSRVAILAA